VFTEEQGPIPNLTQQLKTRDAPVTNECIRTTLSVVHQTTDFQRSARVGSGPGSDQTFAPAMLHNPSIMSRSTLQPRHPQPSVVSCVQG
jgi:hypothetical protein